MKLRTSVVLVKDDRPVFFALSLKNIKTTANSVVKPSGALRRLSEYVNTLITR